MPATQCCGGSTVLYIHHLSTLMKIKEWVNANNSSALLIPFSCVFCVSRLMKIKGWMDANDSSALLIPFSCVFSVSRLMKIKEWVDANDPGALVIPFSCALELNLTDLATNEEREAYLKEAGTTRSVWMDGSEWRWVGCCWLISSVPVYLPLFV